ncbi:MAG: glutamate-ammonia-ligase adenylyltransferase [Spirochaetales bacterium]|nr:glutamate-ammonia-ligase adenylyltransferase [Spirochaetales bacterium]
MSTRPSFDDIAAFNPTVAELEADATVSLKPSACLVLLPEQYFHEFSPATVAEHVGKLCALTAEQPFQIEMDPGPPDVPDRVGITVLSFDVEGMLGLLTGILGASGFDIQTGSVYTLARAAGTADNNTRARRRGPHGRHRTAQVGAGLPARRIVDRFVGVVPKGEDLQSLRESLTDFLGRVLPETLPGRDREVARRMVNEAVADRLRSDEGNTSGALFPVELTFDPSGATTRMTIVGEDTPFFLYSLSTALGLQGVSIESVQINTEEHVIRDELVLADRNGNPITGVDRLDRIRLSVLLIKQFSYFLGSAPDPYAALVRFESMIHEVVAAAEHGGMAGVLSQPLILQELARLLGASDFLWEDFIRGQYENLIPMLDKTGERFSTPSDELEARLETALTAAPDGPSKRAALNAFKDTETFLIDLDHILQRNQDFFFLSRKLSSLAEITVRAALAIAWDECVSRYGVPGSVAGLPATYALFGLGKLGGRAIGYASDVELLFVYSDNGSTDGGEQIVNAEFFERFFTDAAGCIESKREGIFHLDLRLRPYGNAGPHAVSLESFNRYYGREGDAHSYEKLALTRLRFVAGDSTLGSRVEQLRDDLIYGSDSISLRAVGELREKQLAEKASGGRLNAKFSPGGLVDLEYGLQILLVQHGRSNPKLRTPSLHSGVQELSRSGVMDEEEANRLVRAYRFLRNLINGLRMLRGNAQDLFLPEPDSLEYAHLARRVGYRREGDLSAADQLRMEFQARTAAVRAFLEHHLGRDSIPGEPAGTAADLVLSDELSDDLVATITAGAGLRDPRRARLNVRSLAGHGSQRDQFSELIVLAWSSLRDCSDPDMALNNWDRYVSSLSDPLAHFQSLLRQPVKLGLMLQVFSTSQFLAETLIRTPAFLEWALDRSVVENERGCEEMLLDLENELADGEERLAVLRWFRQREILRIGTRDICLRTPIETITRELSALAIAVVRADLSEIWRENGTPEPTRDRFCILAFGKLGGRELNYSSDIDLLGIYEDGVGEKAGRDTAADTRFYASVLETLGNDLSSHTEHGHAFRVDFRLRPHGSSGPLVQGRTGVEKYYRTTALTWEHQALIKLSPIAGNLSVGSDLLDAIKPTWGARWDPASVIGSIERMRAEAVRQSLRRGEDIKSGEGGIRDIEFTVQGLQMIHAAQHPQILTGNTFGAIRALADAGIIAESTAESLLRDYRLLRRVEHFLQVFEDRQVHSLPVEDEHRQALARRIAGTTGDSGRVLDQLARTRASIHSQYERFLQTGNMDEG